MPKKALSVSFLLPIMYSIRIAIHNLYIAIWFWQAIFSPTTHVVLELLWPLNPQKFWVASKRVPLRKFGML